MPQVEDCGETPQSARETHALPRQTGGRFLGLLRLLQRLQKGDEV